MYRLISWEFGYKMYLTTDKSFTTNRAQATVFSDDEWEKRPDLWRENLPSDAEIEEQAGMKMLPGLEAQL